uniref:glutaminase n=1 Tax=Meloidogyne incognita TaxID=6306 RepID=A0A914L4A4_MELIC
MKQSATTTPTCLPHSEAFVVGDRQNSPEDLVFDLFKIPHRDEAHVGRLLYTLRGFGLTSDDQRLAPMLEKMRQCLDIENNAEATTTTVDGMHKVTNKAGEEVHGEELHFGRHLGREQFKACVRPCIDLVSRALRNQLIIPNWTEFTAKIREIFEECRSEEGGDVATYIPQLARADPNRWGLSICTIDGQRFSLGDSLFPWCFQSVSKAFNYAIVASILGDYVHSFVGHEPSGRLFNEICLDSSGKPHNPMINSGAIIVTSLMKKGLPMADRYDFALNEYKKLAGGGYIGFNNATFLSEKKTADRNYALSYYMKENKCFPSDIESIRDELDFYFQLCSLETNCEAAAVMAATLANGGVCSLTDQPCIQSRACRDVLSLMYSCGMYDYSGQFAFDVGLPAKSGVSGGMILVIPNLMGICLFSPRLDRMGNTTRGVLFCQKLVDIFNFHNYDSLLHADSKKIDPRRRIGNKETDLVVNLLFACKNGDLETVRKLHLQGMNLNIVDYDGRTALHLAASEGQTVILRFLLQIAKVDQTIRDRWGRTALDDARTFHRTACMALLLKAAQRKQQKQQTQSSKNTKGLIGLAANNNNNGSEHLPITTNTSTTIESSGGEEEGELEEDEDEELLRSEEGGSMWDDDQPLSTNNNKHHKGGGGGIVSGRSSKAAATAKWMIEHCVDRLSLGGNDEALENGEKSRRLDNNKNVGGHQHKQAAIIASSKFHTSTGD